VGDIADELVRGKGFSGDSGLVDVTVRGAFVSLVVVVFIIAVVLLAALLLGPLLFFENRLRLGRLPKKGVERGASGAKSCMDRRGMKEVLNCPQSLMWL